MEEVPLLNELHTKYAGKAVILGISIDISLERVDNTIKTKKMTYPILADGKGFDGPNPKAYNVQGTPEIYILDRVGRIFARHGTAKLIDASLQDALARAASGGL
jgi:peroxiredoxin